jgi:hypothetical protein
MLACEIIDTIVGAGGQIWQVEDRIRARLPQSIGSIAELIRQQKAELLIALAPRPPLPPHVQLIRWAPVEAPIRLCRWETVIDIDAFIRSTLRQVEARLKGQTWLAGNWALSILIDRLAAVGCFISLDKPRQAWQ